MDGATVEALVILIIAYPLISWIVGKIFSLGKKKRKIYEPLHYIRFFCRHGHYMGDEEPTPGTLCRECIRNGYIKIWCPVGNDHVGEVTKITRPYEIWCSQHGNFTVTDDWQPRIGNRPVSWPEWIRHNRYEPAPIPLPLSNPIAEETFSPGAEQELRKLLKERLEILTNEIHQREKELEVDLQRRRTLERGGIPIGVLLSILLLLVTIFFDRSFRQLFFNEGIELTIRLTELLEQAERLLTEVFVSGITAAALTIVIIVLIKKRKQAGESIDWYELMGSASFALLVELLLARLWTSDRLTIFDLLKSVTLQFVAAIIFAFIYNHKYLKSALAFQDVCKILRRKVREAVALL